MRPIQLQMTVTLNEDALNVISDAVRQAVEQTSAADRGQEQRIRASRHALFGGKTPPAEELALLIDTKQVAKLLNVSDRTVFGMNKDGRMPRSVKIGSAVRWNREELQAWVNAGCPRRDDWTWPVERRD